MIKLNIKSALKILTAAALVFVLLGMLKNGIVQGILSASLSKVMHVSVKIGGAKVSFLASSMNLRNVRVYNPRGFPEKLMVEAPQVAIDFEPQALLKGVFHFKEVKLNLKQVTVIKDKHGRLNVNALKPTEKEKEKVAPRVKEGENKPKTKLQIDRLQLTVGRVVYKDYSRGGEPQVQQFDVNINNRVYTHIDNPTALVSLIMVETLTRTTLGRLAELDLGVFRDTATKALGGGLSLVEGGAGTLEDTAKGLFDLFK